MANENDSRRLILIADDLETNRMVMKKALEEENYRGPLIIGDTHNGLCKCKVVQNAFKS